MPEEIEAKFLDIDIEDIRRRLKDAGAVLEQPMRLMLRDQLDFTDGRYRRANLEERLRIRDEGDKQTLTYKRTSSDSNYLKELEITISSYETAKEILVALGIESFSYQESKRETWHLDDVEVVIDEWPWINPYIEIEGPSEEGIKAAAAKLGFDWEDARYGSVDTVYMAQYPKMTKTDSIALVPIVKFDDPLPQYLKDRL